MIKIGFTRKPKRRLIALNQASEAWFKCRMRFITIARGSRDFERNMLGRFWKYRIQSAYGFEWFSYQPEILIAALSLPRISPVLFDLCTHGMIACGRCIQKNIDKCYDPQMLLDFGDEP